MHPRKAITALTLACAMIAPPTLAATPAAASAKPNVRACYDGKCKFTFTRAVSFRVSSRYGLGRVRVSKEYVGGIFNQDMVVVRAPGLTSSLGEGASGEFRHGKKRTLNFRVLSITDQGATIRFEG
ncbi:hypothetical protein [Nonomuraea sp. JJY05]|jgi:hypothetical protein|uniref:hypothetical protein n=1 Tax=Nonomuraea sp. JJY05 TaxID=3350255 RepID=UPI00373F944F